MIDGWDDLARHAEAATPGPWQRHPSGDGSLFGPDPGVIGQTWGLNWRNDVEFIAAANPATILRLIAERDVWAARLAAVEALIPELEADIPEDAGNATSHLIARRLRAVLAAPTDTAKEN